MNNSLRTLLSFTATGITAAGITAIGVTTAAAPAFCSEFEPLHVTVPFAFKAGRASLPAGDYTVTETENHAVLIRGNHGGAILLGSAGSEEESYRNSLTFQRTDKGTYLKTVRTAGRPTSVLRITETEK